MSKSQTKKQEKWKKNHPNVTRTEWTKIKKLRGKPIVLAASALIANPVKCKHCKKTYDASVLTDNRCIRCNISRMTFMAENECAFIDDCRICTHTSPFC